MQAMVQPGMLRYRYNWLFDVLQSADLHIQAAPASYWPFKGNSNTLVLLLATLVRPD